ncbi:hypothetical protein J3F83DRAFT_744529 [Trichoderma novae-zelandiae]
MPCSFNRLHRSSGNRGRTTGRPVKSGRSPAIEAIATDCRKSPSAPCLACWLSGVTVELGHDMDPGQASNRPRCPATAYMRGILYSSHALASSDIRVCRCMDAALVLRTPLYNLSFLNVSLPTETGRRHQREKVESISALPKAVCRDLFSNPESCMISNPIRRGSSVSPRERTVDLGLRSRSVPGIRQGTASTSYILSWFAGSTTALPMSETPRRRIVHSNPASIMSQLCQKQSPQIHDASTGRGLTSFLSSFFSLPLLFEGRASGARLFTAWSGRSLEGLSLIASFDRSDGDFLFV